LDYKAVGVDSDKKEAGLDRLLDYVNRTFAFNSCRPLLPIGYFANVIDLRPIGVPLGIAFSTDGVGTKLLIAHELDRFDTVGIDCVAMNVNDILCVGATPVSMVDYIATSIADDHLLSEIGKGLYRGCELAGINLSGGELAQVAELLSKPKKGVSFDIVGTAIGTVDPDRILVGQDLKQGDQLIGLESNGLHSNGFTLARKALFETATLSVHERLTKLKVTLGEELLKPTRIYVKEVLEIMKVVDVKAMFHITGGGLFNLVRTAKAVGFHIESFPQPPAIFSVVQEAGKIAIEEMFRVFNMGIGFVLAVSESASLSKINHVVEGAGYKAHRLGHVTDDPTRTIQLIPYGLLGREGKFSS
jgi:phosphoribosylformylglycinamidine cyclo-ligase